MTEPKDDDELVLALTRAISAFLRVKRRYPLLLETSNEIERLRKRRDVVPIAHDAMVQIMRDSFDMLVIDLYSIRESLVRDRGVFDLLKRHPQRLWPRPSSHPAPRIALMVTKQVRSAVRSIVGSLRRATPEMVADACTRFRHATAPLDHDRNRVRAHRYQQKVDTSKFFIPLPHLQTQIRLLERYLSKLYLIVTHGQFSMTHSFLRAGSLPRDIADIVVHGSINAAATYYGVTKRKSDTSPLWYSEARAMTLKARPRSLSRRRPASPDDT